MKRIFICVLLILEAAVLAACLYICLRVPARIRAVPSGVPYEGDEIDASFFNVKVTSLFGREVDADVSVDVSKGAADYTAVFSSGDLQTTSVVKFIPVKKIDVELLLLSLEKKLSLKLFFYFFLENFYYINIYKIF